MFCGSALLGSLRSAINVQQAFAPMSARASRIEPLTRTLHQALARLAESNQPSRLEVLGQDPHSGIVAFQVSGTPPHSVVRRLEAAGIVVRQHYSPPCIRACMHYFTLVEEIDRLCDVIAQVCAETP